MYEERERRTGKPLHCLIMMPLLIVKILGTKCTLLAKKKPTNERALERLSFRKDCFLADGVATF